MDWRTANTSVAVAVPFLVDGEFVIPDAGSVTLTVRGNDGAVLAGYNELPIADVTQTSTLLTIAPEANGIGANPMETRYLRVSYLVGNVPGLFSYAYRLTPFLPITAGPEDVRRVTGIDYKALPDSDVDVHEAYFKLAKDVGAVFVTALTSPGRAAISANNMIALQAAILLLPSLQNRVMKSETSHNEIYIRNTLDLAQLAADLQAALLDETNAMLEELGNAVTSVISPIFLVTSPVDVITGA